MSSDDALNVAAKAAAKKQQVSAWKTAIEQEVQQRIEAASKLRAQITAAKTTTKRQYYDKKFKVISNEVIKLLNLLQQIPTLEGTSESTTPTA